MVVHVIDGVHVLPVLHDRLEFADCVRSTASELKPDAVVVEIPSSLEQTWLQAVDRLPSISVLLALGAKKTTYFPTGNGLVEANSPL